MEFAAFAPRLRDIEAADADTEIQALVSDLLVESDAPVDTVVRLLLGRIFPAHDSRTLDIGPQLCYEAIARAAGQNVTPEDVQDRLAEAGEIGAVAASYDFGGQQGLSAFGSGGRDPLTVTDLDSRLRELAAASGEGSQEQKLDTLFGLFNRTDPTGARYLARLVVSEMRIGVGDGTVRDAIADAFEVPVETVEHALQVTNDYGLVAAGARDGGADRLGQFHLEIGRPVQAMLAQTGSVSDVLAAWDRVTVEWKYDGARVQAHYDGEQTRLFSRNMDEVTDPLPEIASALSARLTEPTILDGEVVAVDDEGDPRPFQAVLRRFRRKHDVARAQEAVTLRFYAFDCLHADGTDLLERPLHERHDHLDAVLDTDETVRVSEITEHDDPEEIERAEAKALDAGHEGLMLKNPESTYTPGKRGQNWLKRKPDVETLDCVVTGAEWGEGRRANLLGSFELSVPATDDYETIGKVATGITDDQLAELTDLLEPHVRTQDGTTVDIEPAVVFEVGYEEIQTSPTYSSGYALRFPRFLGIRDDKDPADADSLARLEELAQKQG
jgi:DNA ligase-1